MGTSGHFAALLSLGVFGAGCLAMGEKLIPIVPSYALLVFIGMTIVPDPDTLVLVIMATAAEPWNFSLAIALGSLAWNTPLLTLGYLLRNTGHDPVYVGLAALCGLIATELVVLVALRVAAFCKPLNIVR